MGVILAGRDFAPCRLFHCNNASISAEFFTSTTTAPSAVKLSRYHFWCAVIRPPRGRFNSAKITRPPGSTTIRSKNPRLPIARTLVQIPPRAATRQVNSR